MSAGASLTGLLRSKLALEAQHSHQSHQSTNPIPIPIPILQEDTVSIPEATWQFRRGWQTKPTKQHRKPKVKVDQPPKVKKKEAVPKGKRLSITEGAAGKEEKEGGPGPETEKTEDAEPRGRTAREVDARDQGAAHEAKEAETGLVKESVLTQKNAETEVVGEGNEPRFAGATVDNCGSLLEGGAAPQFNGSEVGTSGEHHGVADESGDGGREGTREGLILRPGEAQASEGAPVAPEGQRTEKLRPQGGKGAPMPEESTSEDPLFGDEFPDGVRLTDMLMDAETGGTEGPVKLDAGAKGQKADGTEEAREEPSASLREGEPVRGNAEGRRDVAQTGTEHAAEPVGSDVEPEKGPGRRGRKRSRATEAVSDARPQVTRRRSTRQKVEESQERRKVDKGVDGSGDAEVPVVVASDKEGRGKKRGGLQKGRKAEAIPERAHGAAPHDHPEVAPTGDREPVPGKAGGSQRGDAAPEADGGVGEKALEAGVSGASFREPLDAAQTAEERGTGGASAIPEDTALESFLKSGPLQDGASADANAAGGSLNEPPGVAQTASEPPPPSWQLGSLSGPVLFSDDSLGVGSRVEVLQIEEGLAGAWFAGTVMSLGARKKAQVEYDELLENEETGEKLREWIPLQPVATVGIGGLAAKVRLVRMGV